MGFRWRKIPVANGLNQLIDDVNEQLPRVVSQIGWDVPAVLVADASLTPTAIRTFLRADATADDVLVLLAAGERVGQEVRVRRVDGSGNTVTVDGGTANVTLGAAGEQTTLVWTGDDWTEA